MAYRATDESCTLTATERIDEARRIVVDMGLGNETERMNQREREFVEKLANDFGLSRVAFVSIKQLWWLRDLKERYL